RQGEAVNVAVLANDHDPLGGGLTVIAVTSPVHGVANIDPDNVTVHYAPVDDFSGVDNFTYTLRDGNGQQSTAGVAIVITANQDIAESPQVAVIDPTVRSTVYFTSSQATV